MAYLQPDDFVKGMLFTVFEHAPIVKGIVPKMEHGPDGQPSVNYVPMTMPNHENKGSVFRIVSYDLPYVVAELIAEADLQGMGTIPSAILNEMFSQAGFSHPVSPPPPLTQPVLFPKVVFDVRTVKLMPVSREYTSALISDDAIFKEVMSNSFVHNSKNMNY